MNVALQTIGGLGLFLLGMIVMTDGLRALAGNAMRGLLMRFSRTPASGAATGAVTTVILQSSSATTVAAVGFVSAGLMTFPQALGIVFGANLGTTIKGWLVALLGFKFSLGIFLLPLIFVGAVLRLFSHGRWSSIGYALAGFGLIFVGIAQLQAGMSGLEGGLPFSGIDADTWLGRIKLVLIGVLFTAITQSSSAGVAATLAALFANAIQFEQAAALVIGMDIGTTITALMASIGGTVGARRTGYSHVVYNLMTGVGALLLISPYMAIMEWFAPGILQREAELSLVAFHSGFNLLGILLILPFSYRFSHLIQRMVPDSGVLYTRGLEMALLDQPGLALDAVQASIRYELNSLFCHLNDILGGQQNAQRTDLIRLQRALDETHAYVDGIHLQQQEEGEWQRLVALINCLDHMQRLHERCEEEEDRALTATQTVALAEVIALLHEAIKQVFVALESNHWAEAAKVGQEASDTIEKQVAPYRQSVMAKIASGELGVPEGTECLEAIRWLTRVSLHVARISQHYGQAVLAIGK